MERGGCRERERERERPGRERGGDREGERERERVIRIRIRIIYSFRPLPLMKRCRWMTYHLHSTYCNYTYEQNKNKLTTM